MQTQAQTKVVVVKQVNVSYYSDQTAETRILLERDDEEIWFNGVAPVAEMDTVTAIGKSGFLLDILVQTHAKSVVDEIVDEMVQNGKGKGDGSATRQAMQEKLKSQQVFRAQEIIDKGTTYSIPYQQELHFSLTLAMLTFFYPIIACLIALAVLISVNGLNLDKFTAARFFSATTASFTAVSLISLIGDQEVLNILARVTKIDWHNVANKSALKDGKAINLIITGVLMIISALIMLMS